jgi:hypothetical protein
MSKEDAFQWLVVCVVFAVCFVFYFIHGFFANCIFEWPLRFDVKVCWNEQVDPSVHKAAEKAANFVP